MYENIASKHKVDSTEYPQARDFKLALPTEHIISQKQLILPKIVEHRVLTSKADHDTDSRAQGHVDMQPPMG